MDNEFGLGKGLHVAHLNVRSLMGGHKFDVLRHQIRQSGIHIFTISESWLGEAIPDKAVEIRGYNTARLDRSWRDEGRVNMQNPKKGGGLVCYVKEGIKYSESILKHLNTSCKDIEMQWLKISMDNVRPIVIVSVYRPPQGNIDKCCEIICSAFDKANLKDNTDIFVLGDFNVNFLDKTTPAFRELDFTTKSLGLKQLITSRTRSTTRDGILTESLIDLLFTNSEHVSKSMILDFNISDHAGILATRKKIPVNAAKINFRGRSYRNYVKNDFQESIINANWVDFYNNNDPNWLWDYMYNIIIKSIDRMCPMRSFRVTEFKEPWMTNEAIEAINDKDRAMNKARRSKKEEDWVRAKELRNRVGRDIENLRADYLKNQQETHRADPKKFWMNIATIIPGKKGNQGPIWLKSEEGNEVELEDTAAYINKFFTNIGPNLAKKHKSDWEYFGDTEVESIDNITTSQDEVLKLCKEIEVMKASGMDEMSARICKDAFMVLVKELTYLFNCSLNAAIFPEKWKIAKVIPLFKGGDREEVGNYRPVSLLPIPGKLLEKIVHKRITEFWDNNGFLSRDQGGFRKGYSTVATMADLTDDLFKQINQGNTTLATFFDLRKAFDTVNTSILKKKLDRSGIRNKVFRWCSSYLSNRAQCTLANGVTSGILPVTCGVPQGSVLGPLFFLVFVNDIQGAIQDCKIKLYADDTVLYQSGVNCDEASNKLQRSVNRFASWCEANSLTINISKTKTMAFGSRQRVKRAKKSTIKLGEEVLKQVPSYRYLGLILDSTLNYNLHVNQIIRTVLHKLMLLSKMKKYLRDDSALSIYKSMILPYLDYADDIFHKAANKDIDKLQRLQNRCLKLCMRKDRRFSTEEVHRLAKVPMLRDRREAHVLNFMYKRKSNVSLLNNREIRTRAHDAPLFEVIVPRCEAFKRSVGYSGAICWNNLAPNIRNIISYGEFKHKQKLRMLDPLAVIQRVE